MTAPVERCPVGVYAKDFAEVRIGNLEHALAAHPEARAHVLRDGVDAESPLVVESGLVLGEGSPQEARSSRTAAMPPRRRCAMARLPSCEGDGPLALGQVS